jgi:hypothetical protein
MLGKTALLAFDDKNGGGKIRYFNGDANELLATRISMGVQSRLRHPLAQLSLGARAFYRSTPPHFDQDQPH